MNERQARLAVMLADERDAIDRDLKILTDPDYAPSEGLGMVLAFRGHARLASMINGKPMDSDLGRGARRLLVPLPSEVFAAVHAAMVKACEDRLADIALKIRGMGVEP